MIGTFGTILLGVAEKTSARGNEYRVLTFMDDGEPVSVMLSKDFNGKLPDVLTQCTVTVRASLGKYADREVIDIE